jgi:glycosyltransferase involved in cell wall biosynthesis
MPFYEVLIVASRSEAFGRVIVEAHKAGLQVVVKNSGGAPELVNETNGLLYSTEEELVLILAGEKKIPEGPSLMNYNEESEIKKLKNQLIEIL